MKDVTPLYPVTKFDFALWATGQSSDILANKLLVLYYYCHTDTTGLLYTTTNLSREFIPQIKF